MVESRRRAVVLGGLLLAAGLAALVVVLVLSGGFGSGSRPPSPVAPQALTGPSPACPSSLPPIEPGAAAAARTGARTLSVGNPFGSALFGIAAGGAIQDEPAQEMSRDLGADRRAGARWLRVDVNWAQIQRAGPQQYDWSALDRVLAGARRCGLQVLGTVTFSPPWARPAGTTAVYAPDPQAYARFAAVAARHVAARGVRALEIWNEPNVATFWAPRPSVEAYTRMLVLADRAIRSASPGMTVVTGGLSPAVATESSIAPVSFLSGMYSDGAKGSFDAVGMHPYCWPTEPGAADPGSAWYQTYGTDPSIRSVMVANGDGDKAVWGTEFGAPTGGPAGASFVTRDAQAAMIADGYRRWAGYPWAGPLFAYEGRDFGRDTSTIEDFFGLLTVDFERKPAYDAYRTQALLVSDAIALRRAGRAPRSR